MTFTRAAADQMCGRVLWRGVISGGGMSRGPAQSHKRFGFTINRTAAGNLLAAALMLSTCAVGCSDIEVNSAWAPGAAAVPLGPAFAWMANQATPPGSDRPINPQLQELIRGTIESGFAAKGYEKKASGPADFWIGYRMAKDIQGDPHGAAPFEQYTEGTLVIYVVDPQTQQWIWRASAQTRINEANPPETKKQRLQQAVEQMLGGFPARAKPVSTKKN